MTDEADQLIWLRQQNGVFWVGTRYSEFKKSAGQYYQLAFEDNTENQSSSKDSMLYVVDTLLCLPDPKQFMERRGFAVDATNATWKDSSAAISFCISQWQGNYSI